VGICVRCPFFSHKSSPINWPDFHREEERTWRERLGGPRWASASDKSVWWCIQYSGGARSTRLEPYCLVYDDFFLSGTSIFYTGADIRMGRLGGPWWASGSNTWVILNDLRRPRSFDSSPSRSFSLRASFFSYKSSPINWPDFHQEEDRSWRKRLGGPRWASASNTHVWWCTAEKLVRLEPKPYGFIDDNFFFLVEPQNSCQLTETNQPTQRQLQLQLKLILSHPRSHP
jgi:hypothetical protein